MIGAENDNEVMIDESRNQSYDPASQTSNFGGTAEETQDQQLTNESPAMTTLNNFA